MSRILLSPSIREIAKLVLDMIEASVRDGWLRPRTFESIRKALVFGHGNAIVICEDVFAYAEIKKSADRFILRSVVVKDDFQGKFLGWQVVSDRIDYAFSIDPNKPICLSCSKKRIGFFRHFGFMEMCRWNVPDELLGGRTREEWLASDRIWMELPNKMYWEARQNKTPIR